MLEMFGAMARILVAWAAVSAVFTGIGLGLRRLWGPRPITADAVLGSFWIGLAVVVLALSLWHLVWPVRWPVQGVVAGAGAVGLLVSLRPLWEWLRSVARQHPAPLAAAAVMAVLLSNRALGPCTTHDSGLYHLNAVRWAQSFPIIPGLGNLHTSLAFNNVSFLLAAFLEVGPWYGRSSHLANTLYLLVFLLYAILAVSRLTREQPRSTVVAAFYLLMMVPVALMLSRSWAASHNVEVPVAVVMLMAAGRTLAYLTERGSADREGDLAVWGILVLLVLAISIKISSLITAALMGAIVVVTYARRCRRAGRGLGALGWILLLPVLMLGVWLVRGVILSGYLLYPLPLGSFPADWRMPAELVRQAREAIAEDATEAFAQKGLMDWVGHLGREVLMPVVVCLLSGAALVRWRQRLDRGLCGAWLLAGSTIPAIVVWAATAPQKRFAFYLFWILAGVLLALALAAGGFLARRRARIIVGCLLVGVGLVNLAPDEMFYGPGTDGGLHPVEAAELTTYTTSSGLVLYVPKTGTQCWDSPLPSTPYPRPDLRLRRPGDLGSGFVIDPSGAAPPTRPAALEQVSSPD